MLNELGFFGQSLTLVLPLFLSGLVLIAWMRTGYVSALDAPIDHGGTFRDKRLFGDNKKWRGAVAYIIVSLVISSILSWLYTYAPTYIHPLYRNSPLLVGLTFSVSYIAGELANSFVKRQFGIAPGTHGGTLQHIVDTIDGMIVVAIVLAAVFHVGFWSIATGLMIGICLHLVTDQYLKQHGLK